LMDSARPAKRKAVLNMIVVCLGLGGGLLDSASVGFVSCEGDGRCSLGWNTEGFYIEGREVYIRNMHGIRFHSLVKHGSFASD
jgi:hypothetical protein